MFVYNCHYDGTHFSAVIFIIRLCSVLTAAIYLAKRNIRKKGMLEPYEQVGAHSHELFHI